MRERQTRPWIFSFAFVCACVFASPFAAADPDLAGIDYLSPSDDFRVWINGEEQFVYKSAKTGGHGSHDISSMSFMNFDLEAPVEIKIEPRVRVRSYALRPFNANLAGMLDGNVITFSVSEPRHVVLVVNDAYDPVLVIGAKPRHSVPAPASVTHFYGPGVHDLGKHLTLKSGDEVYLAEGAIVKGGFAVQNATNVTIRGRGIIYNGHFPHEEAFRVFKGDATANVLIEGVTITHSPGWIVSFWGGNRDLTVRDVTMVGNWWMNSDGVQTGTEGLLVENSFMQCNDDNFSLNGVCKNVVIRNNVLWNLFNGGVFMLGWATGDKFDLDNLDIHDNVIFRAGGCCDYDRKGPFSMKVFGSGRTVRNIRFRNIIIEDLAPFGRWVDFQAEKAGRSTYEDIVFDNIQLLRAWKVEGELRGNDQGGLFENVVFTNVFINGKLMRDPQAGGLNLVQTRSVMIQGRAFDDVITSGPDPQAEPEHAASSTADDSQSWESVGANLLANPSFESGLTAWRNASGEASEIAVEDASEGVSVLQVVMEGRSRWCLEQDITAILREQGPGNYTYGAALRSLDGPIRAKVTLVIEDENGLQQHPSPDVTAVTEGWQQARRRNAFQWNGLRRAWFRVEAVENHSGNLQVDACWLSR